ncbi:MAG: decaprenyl-phosphate phosphoribosyltransferase [Nitrospinota bacterium]|nr:MAG: decaprenyl-phosphate phosphoribosyltransferase [Nitrospinota bacterium]
MDEQSIRLFSSSTWGQQLSLLVQAMRPYQWVKNLVLFAGLLFSQRLFHLTDLLLSFSAFVLFCLLSSAVYICNDFFDVQADREHPSKRFRPLASGKLHPRFALIGLLLLLLVSLPSAFLLRTGFGLVALGYVLLNLLYSRWLKQMVIVDVMAIATGFVLRAMAGAVVIEVEISLWLILCTFLLALFLACNKRRQELVHLRQEARNHRQILEEYSPYFLDLMINVVTASTVIAYALYTMDQETIQKFQTDRLIITTPFVMYGIFRYLYLVHKRGEGENPTRLLLTDRPLQINLLLWILAVGIIIYA